MSEYVRESDRGRIVSVRKWQSIRKKTTALICSHYPIYLSQDFRIVRKLGMLIDDALRNFVNGRIRECGNWLNLQARSIFQM